MNDYRRPWLFLVLALLVGCAETPPKQITDRKPVTIHLFSDFTITSESKPADILNMSRNEVIGQTVLDHVSEKLLNLGYTKVDAEYSCMGCIYSNTNLLLQVQQHQESSPQTISSTTMHPAPFYLNGAYSISLEKTSLIKNAFTTLFNTRFKGGGPYPKIADLPQLRTAANEDVALFMAAGARDASFFKNLLAASVGIPFVAASAITHIPLIFPMARGGGYLYWRLYLVDMRDGQVLWVGGGQAPNPTTCESAALYKTVNYALRKMPIGDTASNPSTSTNSKTNTLPSGEVF